LHHSPQNNPRPTTTLPISGIQPAISTQSFPNGLRLPLVLALRDGNGVVDDPMSVAVASRLASKNGDASFASLRPGVMAPDAAISLLEGLTYTFIVVIIVGRFVGRGKRKQKLEMSRENLGNGVQEKDFQRFVNHGRQVRQRFQFTSKKPERGINSFRTSGLWPPPVIN
jgi:hypothetical protein